MTQDDRGAPLYTSAYHRRFVKTGCIVAVWKRTHLLLPEGWYEVPGQTPREYRRARPGSGVLQLQYLRPRAEVRGTDEEIDHALTDILAEAIDILDVGHGDQLNLGEPVSCTTGPCAYGRYATALFSHPQMGWVRLWFLGTPGEPLLFATFVKSGTVDWDEESADVDPWYGGAPGEGWRGHFQLRMGRFRVGRSRARARRTAGSRFSLAQAPRG